MKIGFIGCGNMAGAIIGGIVKNGIAKPEDIVACDVLETALARAKEEYGIETVKSAVCVMERAQTVFLAVKPQFYAGVIEEIKGLAAGKLIITIAPGKTLEWLDKSFGGGVHIIRTMPNTPAMVAEGITAVCPNGSVTDEELKSGLSILGSFGRTEIVPERLMDAVVAVSGSSPAYVFILIEAMADAAVEAGMPRAQAYTFASQAVLGSARMALETGKHPAELKDMVCSPAGTTIEAVRVLEERGFRSAVIEAMRTCAEKSASM